MITTETLVKSFQKISWRYSLYDVVCDTIAMAAYALANGLEYSPFGLDKQDERREYWKEHNDRAYKREVAYLDCIKRYNRQEQEEIGRIGGELSVLLSRPAFGGDFDDYLGKVFMQLGLGNKFSGQFFTPYHVSRLMAEISMGTISSDEILTVSDPCIGAGGMVLAAANIFQECGIDYASRMLAIGCDIDIRCVHMAYLQLAWAGIPAIIYHGNSLTLETWDEWHTPAYIFNYWRFQRARRKLQDYDLDVTLRPVIGPYFEFSHK